MMTGLGAGAAGAVLVALNPARGSPWALAISAVPLGLTAMAMPAMTATAMAGAPGHRVGLASGVLNAARQTGGAFGIAVLGALLRAEDAVSVRAAFVAVASAYGLGIVLAAVGRSTARRPRTRPQESRMTVAAPHARPHSCLPAGGDLAPPLELGAVAQGRRRIVALTGGTFTGPELSGTLLPGGSADWQILLDDGTALGDIRYTLQTDGGDLLYVQSRSVRHGPAAVLARLSRGEDVAPAQYTFRTATQIETAAPHLEWLNKGVFVGVAGRQPAGVIYEVYLVE